MNLNFIGEFFNNSYSVAAATLIATVIIGIGVPVIIYWVEQSKKDAWSLEKKEDNLWELTRTRSKQAFIHQVYGDPLCFNDFTVAYRGLGGIGTPYRSYGNNEKVIVEIIPISEEFRPSSSFHICYSEHGKRKDMKLPDFVYNSDTTMHVDYKHPCKNKHWSRPLY